MSKYLKNLITDDLKSRWEGVNDVIVVNVQGLDANKNNRLRTALAEKDIQLMVVKNSMARRAAEGTPLAPAFEGLDGPAAVCWGGEDVVTLAKEIERLQTDKEFEAFEARGGAMEGSKMTAEDVKAVSKWPSREEQLSILMGQIVGVASTLSGQLVGPASTLVGQFKQLAEGEGEGEASEEAAEAAGE